LIGKQKLRYYKIHAGVERPISIGRTQILQVEHFGDDLAFVSLLDLV
jgi:hypothetical protein